MRLICKYIAVLVSHTGFGFVVLGAAGFNLASEQIEWPVL